MFRYEIRLTTGNQWLLIGDKLTRTNTFYISGLMVYVRRCHVGDAVTGEPWCSIPPQWTEVPLEVRQLWPWLGPFIICKYYTILYVCDFDLLKGAATYISLSKPYRGQRSICYYYLRNRRVDWWWPIKSSTLELRFHLLRKGVHFLWWLRKI